MGTPPTVPIEPGSPANLTLKAHRHVRGHVGLVAPETDRRIVAWIRWSGTFAGILIALGVLMNAFYAPTQPDCAVTPVDCQTSPLGQRIFYVHAPVASAAYLAFALLAFASYRSLVRSDEVWDAFAVGAAEVGVLLAGLTLFTGSLWGHLEWGIPYWNNKDTKLVLTLVMFLIYVAYLVLRRQIADPRRRARVAAVYAILGFVTVPLALMAQKLWASVHPRVNPALGGSGFRTVAAEQTFFVNLVAFVALALFFMLVRLRVELAARERGGGGT